jgi:hypothetical protein
MITRNSISMVALVAAVLFAAPKIQFEAEELDLGRLLQGESRDFSFEVKNAGDAVLEISEVRPTCGCTSTGKGQYTIKPGGKATIPFTFNTGNFMGEQHKSMSVRSNDPDRSIVNLKFSATIEAIIDLEPHYISFEVPTTGTLSVNKINITNRYTDPIKYIDADIGDLNVMLFPQVPMKKLEVRKDSTLTFELSTLFTTQLTESKYGQVKFKIEFADGRKLDKTVGVAIRK